MMRDKLSEKRRSEVSTEFNNTFRKWAAARQIFDVVSVGDLQNDEEVKTDDLAKIGLHRLLKRNFFTEPKGTTFYDHEGIGLSYGKGIALGEMRYVFKIMVDCKDVIGFNKNDITNLIQFANGNSDTESLVILINPANFKTFLGNNEFTSHVSANKSLWGFIKDIPVYWTPVITKDKIYIFNKNIGKIIVDTDAHIIISEIIPSEYDSIIKNIPTITKDELENYVRVMANEVIKFHLRE